MDHNKDVQKSLSLWMALFAVVGFVLMGFAFRGENHNTSAFLLGVFLVSIAFFFFFVGEEIELDLDFDKRQIRHTKKNRFQEKVTHLPFSDIQQVAMQRVGRSGKPGMHYVLELRLKNGTKLSTGQRYFDRLEAQNASDALAQQLGTESRKVTILKQSKEQLIAWSAGIAILSYALYYRSTVGPWCPAMWGGTLPPFFIGVVFISIYGTLRGYSAKNSAD